MVRGTPDVLHALTTKHLLEFGFASPGRKLPAVVGENFPRSSPLADGSPDYLQDSSGCLLAKQTMAYDVTGVIIDDPHQVDTIEPFQFKGEDIDLPEGIGNASFEATDFWFPTFRFRRAVAESGIVYHPPDSLGAD